MRRLAAWVRRLLPRPTPPESVLLWLPDYTHTGPAPLRYDGIDENGYHVWTALFDEHHRRCIVHIGPTGPRTRVRTEYLSPGRLARAIAELDETS